jgi:hypothetical protein
VQCNSVIGHVMEAIALSAPVSQLVGLVAYPWQCFFSASTLNALQSQKCIAGDLVRGMNHDSEA